MEAGAKVLWPERENLKALMMMRVTGSLRAFESEKQNNPVDPSKCDWPESCFTGSDIFFSKWPTDLTATVCALDPSMGKTDKSGDFQAMVKVGIDANQNYWVDCDMGRTVIDGCIDKYVEWSRGTDKAVCEADQFEEILQKDIVRRCGELGVDMKIHEPILTQGINKNMRIRRISPLITRRRMRFRRSTGTSELIRQLQDFPNGQYDDGPDALEMACRTLEGYIGQGKRNFGKGGFFG
jgi:predicted phage terminase large subunit-like protein